MSQTQEQRTQAQREKQLIEMEQDLGACRAAILRSVVIRSMYRMMLDFVSLLAVAAVAEILSSVVRLFAGGFLHNVGISPASHGTAGLLVLIAGTCYMIVQAFRRIAQDRPGVCETAERLDLAVDDHNRIATAWWLMKSNQHGPFVDAAINDGLTHLKLFSSSTPDRSGPRPILADYRGRLLTAGLLVAVAILFQPGAPYFPDVIGEQLGQVAQAAQGTVPTEATETLNSPMGQRPPSATPERVASSEPSAATASEAAKKLPGSDKETEGSSGRGKSSSAQSSSSVSAANSSSCNSSSETKGKLAKKPGKEKKPYKETKAQKPQDSKSGSSSVSQGSSGGGSMLAVQHDWSQHAQAAGSESEEERDQDEQEMNDENEESRQRNGIQPTLKDRNESPSRELGISEGDGPPGTGRSGPTPPKKSRGTASLVLGVPVPDFVRGRLASGPTKITQERVRPIPMGSQPSDSTTAKRRTLPEPVVPRATLPAEMLPLVREYLIQLHKTAVSN